MAFAKTRDGTRLYYEEVGSGTPILFLHEFGGDYRSWEPQLRFFSRRHRAIVYSARGYLPSEAPAAPDAYSFRHFMNDAIDVLDQLAIRQAHLVGAVHGWLQHPTGWTQPSGSSALAHARGHRFGLGAWASGGIQARRA